MINDDTRLTEIAELEKARSQRRLKKTLSRLLDEARHGTLTCLAYQVYYKDGTSELVVAGGTPEEQAVALAKLEAAEREAKALMAELRPIADAIFAHLPEEERRRVLDSPERVRLAFNTLSDDQRTKLSPLIQERLTKYQTLLNEQLLPPNE